MAANKLCEAKWKQRTHDTHQKHLEYLASEQGQLSKVLLLGSSMFERFFTTGKKYNEKYFQTTQRSVAIAGVGGDGIQHMLYRIEHGLLEACPAAMKVLVLQAGTNNCDSSSAEQVVTGVKYLVAEIKRRRPDLQVILFGLAPRDSQRKKLTNESLMERIKQINQELESTPGIDTFVNIFDQYSQNGKKDSVKYEDHVHFNSRGYGIFAKALVTAIDAKLDSDTA